MSTILELTTWWTGIILTDGWQRFGEQECHNGQDDRSCGYKVSTSYLIEGEDGYIEQRNEDEVLYSIDPPQSRHSSQINVCRRNSCRNATARSNEGEERHRAQEGKGGIGVLTNTIEGRGRTRIGVRQWHSKPIIA